MASGVYMEFPNIKGESKDDAHKDWIKLASVNFNVSVGASMDPSETSSRVMGHSSFGPIGITKTVDISTPKLMFAVMGGTALKAGEEVTIEFMQQTGADSPPFCYLKYILDECLIDSYSISSDEQGGSYENLTLTYTKIKVEYKPEKDAGAGGTLPIGWDLRTHKKC